MISIHFKHRSINEFYLLIDKLVRVLFHFFTYVGWSHCPLRNCKIIHFYLSPNWTKINMIRYSKIMLQWIIGLWFLSFSTIDKWIQGFIPFFCRGWGHCLLRNWKMCPEYAFRSQSSMWSCALNRSAKNVHIHFNYYLIDFSPPYSE